MSGKAARVDPRFFNSINQLSTIFMTLPALSGELWDGVPAAGYESERSAHRLSGELHGTEEILDVHFVDDGCFMITHKQAAELVGKMRVLMAAIVSIFSRFQLSVNMAKGKTEVMLALRGKNATMERERSREALMACGWTSITTRDRCNAKRTLSRKTSTWERG